MAPPHLPRLAASLYEEPVTASVPRSLSLDALERRLPGPAAAAAFRALRRYAQRGWRLYLVGGPVRDALLGRPVGDLDFAVAGDALALAAELQGELGGEWRMHTRFGTASGCIGGQRIDLAGARRERYARPGALPQVAPGSIEDDLARRDFTINAMALPLYGARPRVVDYGGGRDDLAAGVIRVLHPGSFADDPTRMLRAVRYEQRLGFRLEETTAAQLRQAVSDGLAGRVTGDRWRSELERIFAEERPIPALRRAAGLGLLAALHPALNAAGGLERLAAALSSDAGPDAAGPAGASATDCLAALVCGMTPGEGEEVIRRLRLTKRQAGLVRDTIELRRLESDIAAARCPSRLVRLLEPLGETALAAWAKIGGSPTSAAAVRRYLAELRYVRPALRGGDLLAMGAVPGPALGALLAQLRAARLDGRAQSVADERRLAAEWLNGAAD